MEDNTTKKKKKNTIENRYSSDEMETCTQIFDNDRSSGSIASTITITITMHRRPRAFSRTILWIVPTRRNSAGIYGRANVYSPWPIVYVVPCVSSYFDAISTTTEANMEEKRCRVWKLPVRARCVTRDVTLRHVNNRAMGELSHRTRRMCLTFLKLFHVHDHACIRVCFIPFPGWCESFAIKSNGKVDGDFIFYCFPTNLLRSPISWLIKFWN